MTIEGCTYIDMPQGEQAAYDAMDEIIEELNELDDDKNSDNNDDNDFHIRDTHIDITGDNARSYLISQSGSIQVERGVTFTNNSRTWEYKVGEKDKRIKILSDGVSDIDLEVVDKPRPETYTPIGHIYSGDNEGGALRATGDFSISHVTFMSIADDLTVVLSDDYSRCIGSYFNRFFVNVKSRARLFPNVAPNEQVALESLREIITEMEFRKYLKYGFVLVNGADDNIYQIFRDNRSHIKVWNNGKVIKEICVRIKDINVPFTDNVIALKVIAETDTTELEKMGNVYRMTLAA